MLNKMTVYLSDEEMDALIRISRVELRSKTDQARVFLRQELEKRGVLPLLDVLKIEENQTTGQEAHQ